MVSVKLEEAHNSQKDKILYFTCIICLYIEHLLDIFLIYYLDFCSNFVLIMN